MSKQSTSIEDELNSLLEKPNFSMPADVATHAWKAIPLAEKSGNDMELLTATAQYTIARNLVTSDSTEQIYRMLESLPDRVKSPYREMAYLLEANFLSQMYLNNRWNYDRRELPLEQISENPKEWSGTQYTKRISELSQEALTQRDITSATPLDVMAPLVSIPHNLKSGGLTVYDFIVYNLIDLYKGDDKDSFACTLLTELIGIDKERARENENVLNGALLLARVSRLEYLPYEEKLSEAKSVLEDYRYSPVYDIAIASIYSEVYHTMQEPQKQEFYNLVVSACDRYKEVGDAESKKKYDNLSYIAASIVASSVQVSSATQVLPGKPIDVTWSSTSCREFNILLVKVPSYYNNLTRTSEQSLKYDIIKKSGKVIASKIVSCDLPLPFDQDGSVSFEGVDAGFYVLVASSDGTLAGMKEKGDFCTINVSNLTYLQMWDRDKTALYIVNGVNGAPVKGASVEIYDSYDRNSKQSYNISGSDGRIELPSKSSRYIINVKHFENTASFAFYNSEHRSKAVGERLSATLLTDLAIYHPGDSLRCVGVMTRCLNNIVSAYGSREVQFRFYDANYQRIDSLKCITDASGRTEVQFRIPEQGMTGYFTIEIYDVESNTQCGITHINVEDYKSPTFRVTQERPEIDEENLKRGEIILRGNASTYSGMPVADADVTLDVEYNSWFRFRRNTTAKTLNLSTKTDAEGNYEFKIDKSLLDGISSMFGLYIARTSVTSSAGETQDSDHVRFSIGERYSIQTNIPNRIRIDSSESEISLPVTVVNAVGNPVKRPVSYKIEGIFGSNIVMEGEFESGKLTLPNDRLPSGEYRMTFVIAQPATSVTSGLAEDKSNIDTDTVITQTVIWRPSDKIAPSSEAVWSPVEVIYAKPNAKNVSVPVGNAYQNGYIYMIESRSQTSNKKGNKNAEVRVLKVSAEMKNIEISAPAEGERVRVTFLGVHDLRGAKVSVDVRPASENVEVKLYTETFRDRITPGSTESWKFILQADGQPIATPAAMAVLSNKALDALVPFVWNFNPYDIRSYNYNAGGSFTRISSSNMYVTWSSVPQSMQLPFYVNPKWYFYGQSLYSENGTGMMIRGTRKMYKNSAAMAEVCYDAIAMVDMSAPLAENDVEYVTGSIPTNATDSGASADVPLREVECPLAFFRPLLTGNEQGEIEITFEVPDFNTEWQLQLIGYNPVNMESAKSVLTTVASKPVMVQTNMPRFLRTGDKTIVQASVFNNSDETLDITAIIEIFDSLTGKVYKSREQLLEDVAPSASAVVNIAYDVPDDINVVGIRSRVCSSRGSDGEQALITILPSSQPVYDAETWYLGKDDKTYSMKLPKMDRNASVTLEYCDNPLWYVLMSLNDIMEPQGNSVLMLADALYSNSVGAGVLRRNPILSSALKRVMSNGDSAAVTSPLRLNETIKLSDLNNTPWVNNAEAETERMRHIADLTDDKRVGNVVTSLSRRLADLQASDGGWSWCAGMPSSQFMTVEVLWRMAAMKTSGDLPEDMSTLIDKGIQYCDNEIAREWREAESNKRKYTVSYSDVEYLYIRNILTSKKSEISSKLESKVIEMVRQEWENYDVSMKCLSAMMLDNAGEKSLSHDIMASVRQFASYTPQKGMWFDSPTGALSRTSPVLSAAVGLMAFQQIYPGDMCIDRLRQYLILSRQTQEWQMNLSSAKVVIAAQAVLASTDISESVTGNRACICIDGRELDMSGFDGMPGSMVINLDPKEVSGKTLTITRTGGAPAWGGVISSYIAPLKDIKPRSMEQISIAKALYPVTQDNSYKAIGNASERFKKGDRVRVTLTLTTDRDLDYLMIRDERGAWMEPREQLTGYEYEDGVWYVREQRNSFANIYSYHLPKGVHVLSYEVTADRDGEYTSGTATAQSQYYPLITARSGITTATITMGSGL